MLGFKPHPWVQEQPREFGSALDLRTVSPRLSTEPSAHGAREALEPEAVPRMLTLGRTQDGCLSWAAPDLALLTT